MNRLNDLKINVKLIGGFGLVAMLLLMGTLMGYLANRTVSQSLLSLGETHLAQSDLAFIVSISTSRLQNALLQALSHPDSLGTLQAEANQTIAQIDQNLKGLSGASQALSVRDLLAAWQAYKSAIQVLLNSTSGSDGGAEAAISAADQSYQFFLSAVEAWQTAVASQSQSGMIADQTQSNQLGVALLAAGGLGILFALLIGYAASRNISDALGAVVANLQHLSQGELETTESQKVWEMVAPRGDELGALGKALWQVEKYLQTSAGSASQVADGNLTVAIQPFSPHDLLGNSMRQMVQNLNTLASQVATGSQHVGQASHELLASANFTNQETAQISTTIREVAQGINQQNDSLEHILASIEQTALTLQRVSQGVQKQRQAIEAENRIASQMNADIQSMTGDIQNVVQVSKLSSDKAQEGAQTVHQAISSMDGLQAQMATLDEKVSRMAKHSNEINGIVAAIEDIALKTNILAINASIEAAHAKTQSTQLTETILNQMMLSQCQVVARLLTNGGKIGHPEFWTQLGQDTALDTILVTDADGVVVFSSEPSLMGWKFPDDPKSQTYPFCKLIHQKNGIYCQESQSRSLDKKVFKYVGMTRPDEPGVIQVGFSMESLKKFEIRIDGFSIVAEEVYNLSEQSRTATSEIRRLISGIQTSVREAAGAMQSCRSHIDHNKVQSDQAAQVLASILAAAQEVNQQAQHVLVSTQQMRELAKNLACAVVSVAQVADQNASDADELSNGYDAVAQTIESIASLSLQNSAAAGQVRNSSEEMRVQMEQVKGSANSLSNLAENLQQAVLQFHLN